MGRHPARIYSRWDMGKEIVRLRRIFPGFTLTLPSPVKGEGEVILKWYNSLEQVTDLTVKKGRE